MLQAVNFTGYRLIGRTLCNIVSSARKEQNLGVITNPKQHFYLSEKKTGIIFLFSSGGISPKETEGITDLLNRYSTEVVLGFLPSDR